MASIQTIRLIAADNEVITVDSHMKYESDFIMDALRASGEEDNYVVIPMKEVNGQALKMICDIFTVKVGITPTATLEDLNERFLNITEKQYSDLLQAAEHLRMSEYVTILKMYKTCKVFRNV